MSGAVAGLIGSVKAAAASPTNLVLNPSFTTDLTGWNISGYIFRDTTVYNTAPASLNVYFSEEYGVYAEYSRGNILTVGQRYSVSFWLRTTTSDSFVIVLSGGVSSEIAVTGSTSWQNIKFENVLVNSVNLNLAIYSSLALTPYFNIDDVSVVAGPTALVL